MFLKLRYKNKDVTIEKKVKNMSFKNVRSIIITLKLVKGKLAVN